MATAQMLPTEIRHGLVAISFLVSERNRGSSSNHHSMIWVSSSSRITQPATLIRKDRAR